MIKSTKTLFIIILLSLNINVINAQYHSFTNYSVNDGLSQSVVNCIFQDSYGYLWIGTQMGLNKFNGYTFDKYFHNPTDTTTISDNWIYSIIEDQDKNIWIATKNGLNKFDRKTAKFYRIHFRDSKNNYINNAVYGLDLDKNGNILINTPPILHIYNPNTNQTEYYTSSLEVNTAISEQCIPILEDSNEQIWIANQNGLCKFDYKNKSFTSYQSNPNKNNSISDNEISAIYEDSKNNIWIATSNGLNKYNKKEDNFIVFDNTLINSKIHSIIEDKQNNFWLGTDGGGLYKFKINDNKIISTSNYTSKNSAISNDIIVSFFIDKSDNLWIGTLNGLNKTDLKRKKFQLYRKSENQNSVNLLDNVIASIYKENNNIIWIGNWGKGLNIYNRKTNEVKHYSSELSGNNYIPNDYVHVIFNDSKKNTWIGTRDGILIYNKPEQNFIRPAIFFENDSFPSFTNNRIYKIIESKTGEYWIATQNGLHQLDIKTGKKRSYYSGNSEPRISGNQVYSIIEDSEGLIWTATFSGLDFYNPKTKKFTHFLSDINSTNSLCDNFVVSLCEDFEGNIWIGTQTGVNKYIKSTKTFEYYSVESGLPDNLIYEILEDDNKNIWFASQNGLAKFDPTTKKFEIFSTQQGLQSSEFNLRASYKSPDGEMFFGGMNGFNSFYPDSLFKNKNVPPIVLSCLKKTDGQIINLETQKEIILNYNESSFTIEFAALDYTNPTLNQYSYILEGLDEKWINIENRRFVPFSNMPPGEYILRIKGTNNDGVWNNIGSELKITIKPPWWKTTFAYVIYLIIIVLSIILFIKLRERKLIAEKNNLENKIAERTKLIAKQNHKLEKTNREITDSINYASKIQTAILPDNQLFEENFSDFFVLFKPRDIVSGDFYWIRKINEYTVFAAADCTGHGVPGAFLSMLGISLLNEIVVRKEITQANQILETMRTRIKAQLKQKNIDSASKDGMDIALCIVNEKTNIMQYSGAYNPLYIIKKEDDKHILKEIKATRNPIGIHIKEKPFENHNIKIEKNDLIYIFSDGYADQFSGSSNRKFMPYQFKNLLIENADKKLKDQKDILISEFEKWKGSYFQLDDILIIGVKI